MDGVDEMDHLDNVDAVAQFLSVFQNTLDTCV